MTSHFISYFARRADAQQHIAQQVSIGSTISHSFPPSPSSSSKLFENNNPQAQQEGSGESCEGCTFCEIVKGNEAAFIVGDHYENVRSFCVVGAEIAYSKVYEDQNCVSFLDILPIREGHLLVIPKKHYERVSHLPDDLSAAIGKVLPRIARALCIAVGQQDFNIVSNQGYAQIVHHVHYHLVPAPLPNSPIRSGWASILGRDQLDEEEATALAEHIRKEIQRESERDIKKAAKL